MANERMVRGAALRSEDAGDGIWVPRIGAQAIDGLGGEGHQPTGSEDPGPRGDAVGHDAGHAGDVPTGYIHALVTIRPAGMAAA